MPERSPKALWETTLGQLELQVTRPNFDTWLRDTVGLRLDRGTLTVGAPTDFAIEWLRSRMSAQIGRTFSQIAGSDVKIAFEVLGAQPATDAPAPSNGAAPAPPPFSLAPDRSFTFEAFTVVDSNRVAYRAAERFATGREGYSPLVFHGAPGLGKTHLLHAIAHAARADGRTVVLLTGEEFVSRYAATVRGGHPHLFREDFQRCDLLLIDDMHYLASRLGSQEQFFNIFNSMHAADKRVAVACERTPDDIEGLSSHLRSRLQAGLAIEMKTPKASERMALLRTKRDSMRHRIDDDVIAAVAELPHRSVREIEGALNRIDMYAEIHRAPLTVASLPAALTPFAQEAVAPNAQQILDRVCAHFHISPHDLSGQSRSRDITYARHIAMYLLRNDAHHSLAEIGTMLGGRNHATVISGCKRIKDELATYESARQDVAALRAQLGSHAKTG